MMKRLSLACKNKLITLFFLILLTVLLFSNCLLPTYTYFTHSESADSIVLTVTESENKIRANVDIVFNDGNIGQMTSLQDSETDLPPDEAKSGPMIEIPGMLVPEPSNICIYVGGFEEYSAWDIDVESISVASLGVVIPYNNMQIQNNQLLIILDYNTVLELLGYGQHILNIEGVFFDGWTLFSEIGLLEFIEPVQPAGQQGEQQSIQDPVESENKDPNLLESGEAKGEEENIENSGTNTDEKQPPVDPSESSEGGQAPVDYGMNSNKYKII